MSKPSERKTPPLVLTGDGKTWVWVTALLIALGWYKTINLVLLLGYLMFAMVVLNGLLARRQTRRIAISRAASLPSIAGEEASIRLTVTNLAMRSATVSIEDRAGDEIMTWLVHRLPGQESTTCSIRRRFQTRGRFATQARVLSSFPFGLLKYEGVAHPGPDLVILPAPGFVDIDGMQRWLKHTGGTGRARKLLRRVTTDQAEVRGVRPFRPGDAIRSVHWRSTARRRELMVREYDVAPSLDLVLVVEPWLPADPTPRQREDLETALSLAVTIVQTWSRVYGTTVVVAVAGARGGSRIATPNGVAVRAALDPLAGVTGETAFPTFGANAFGRSLARAVRVLVSSRASSPYADALKQSTGRAFLAVSPADHPPWFQAPVIARATTDPGISPVPLLPSDAQVEHPDIK